MKRPLLGYSLTEEDLNNFSFEKYPFETFEIGRETTSRFNIKKIITRIKEPFKKIPLSVHSNLGMIFSCEDYGHSEFREAEIYFLKGDIIASKIAGIDRITFHSANKIFNKKEKEDWKKIIDFAKENKIRLILETNTFSKAEYVLDFLNEFPEVDHCIDFGHLNISIKNNKLGMDLEKYLDKVKDRVTHIHAHNNFGEKDTHGPLDEGNFPWKETLKKLNHVKRIIFESNSIEEALYNKSIIEDFYNRE